MSSVCSRVGADGCEMIWDVSDVSREERAVDVEYVAWTRRAAQ